eukprot:g9456.t1
MSLHFPQDQLSKREKQELFKRSLDDQRRVKEEAFAQQHQLPSNAGNRGRHAPGLGSTLPGGLPTSVPRLNHIPGLEQHQVGHAPRFEGSPSPQQEKQPYMSALSEMNGRPLHIRQQQFQKESQYRNMLKDQIAENKKRKDAEKAKLEEEKRRELEEVRRLQGIPAPRRQQHKQFQESPDHPLPSPGRLPPATHHYPATPHLPRPGDISGSYNYAQAGAVTPVHDSSGDYSAINPPGIHGLDGEGRWQGQRSAPDGPGGGGGRTYSERPQQASAASCSTDVAANGHPHPTDQPTRPAAPSRPFGGDNLGAGNAGRPRDRLSDSVQSLCGEGTARELAFEGARARWGDGGAAENVSDSVPRADFDELSSLCRDLLHEQKQLRQKLEEREERERLAVERAAQQEEATRQHRQQQQQRGIPRRGGGRSLANQGTASSSGGGGDGRRWGPLLARESKNAYALRQDQRPKPKPGVAFGSSRPRMPGPTVDKPRASGGGHDRRARVSKSEPVPATSAANTSKMRHRPTRTLGSAGGGASRGSGEKLYTSREPSDSGWPSRSTAQGAKGDAAAGAETGRFAGSDRDRGVGGEWTSRGDPRLPSPSPSPEMPGGGGNSTIHNLLRSGGARHGVASRGTEARTAGDASDELGGESTFLAAHPMDSGLVASQGEGLRLLGRGAVGHF